MKHYTISLAYNHSLLIIFILVMLGSTGCTTTNTFPTAARGGDTIVEAVGSPNGMITSGPSANTTITWTPWSSIDCDEGLATGAAVPLSVRGQFNLYPDKTSPAWLESSAVMVEETSGHGPHTTVLMINLPTTGLTVGHGCININTAASYPSLQTHINQIPINLEILPGTGSINPLTYELLAGVRQDGLVSDLAPKRRIVVKPGYDFNGPGNFAAVEVEVTIPNLNLVTDPDVLVIADEKIRFTTVARGSYTWSQSGDIVKVIFTSHVGEMKYYDAHFFILSDKLMQLIDVLTDVSEITVTATYYDINGVVVAGPPLTIVDET